MNNNAGAVFGISFLVTTPSFRCAPIWKIYLLLFRSLLLSMTLVATAPYALSEAIAERVGAPQLSLEDRVEILELMARYAHYIDANEPEAWARLFTVDGEFTFMNTRLKGYDQLLAWIKKDIVRPTNGPTFHFVGDSILVKMPDGSVHARSKSITAIPTEGPFPTLASGVYHDVIVKTEQGWRFASRKGAAEIPMEKVFLPK